MFDVGFQISVRLTARVAQQSDQALISGENGVGPFDWNFAKALRRFASDQIGPVLHKPLSHPILRRFTSGSAAQFIVADANFW